MGSIYLGLISGTSTDGIDTVVVSIDGQGKTKQLAARVSPYQPSLRKQLFALQTGKVALDELGSLDTQIGEAFAKAANESLAKFNIDKNDVQAIGSHGQTILHRPDVEHPFTLQLGDPNIVAERTGITTVADFRRRDIAAGGQGAPLVPAFHQAWLNDQDNTIVLNLGGIANITVLNKNGAEPTLGFDTGPANTLMDAWTNKHLSTDFDEDGHWAKQGTVDKKLLGSLLKHPYFRQSPPKSADISQFSIKWLENFLSLHGNIPVQNVAATLVELSVVSIIHAVDQWAPETEQVVACGGGCFNSYFMERLAGKLSPKQLCASSDFGIEPEWVEATAFAWLAHQTMHNQPGNSPASTGAKGLRILGGIYQA